MPTDSSFSTNISIDRLKLLFECFSVDTKTIHLEFQSRKQYVWWIDDHEMCFISRIIDFIDN